MIEWMLRSRKEEDGWRDLRTSANAPAPTLDTGGVRVPVAAERWSWSKLPRPRFRYAFTYLRLGLLVAFLGVYLVRLAAVLVVEAWWARLVLALVVGVAVYRARRLRRWRRGAETDLVLSPDGIRVGGLGVPWYQVEDVVRFNFLVAVNRNGSPARNFLAVRVHDFVGVSGLTPFQAGLANLTRRHLVVLAEAAELRAPNQLTAALEELVANPESRAVLAVPDGCRFVDEGPGRLPRPSP